MSASPSHLEGAAAPAVLQQLVHELPDACERLAYVRKMTEQAATTVLELVERAQDDAEQVRRQGADLSEMLGRQALSQELTLERARSMLKLCAAYAATAAGFAERERSLHTELMMAQGFQDLSGQVINKVVKLLERSEQPLVEVLAGLPNAMAATMAAEAAVEQDQSLEGVQTPDKALQQDDVDDLLASLGF
ncbi:protein phosphatase CheZ [Paucibacter sp. R3-3]|uniref:Protein phosphatase CheZ n=1 Tax=Roseateles agri TaxID=3098619 RepID=A0ABU5DA87_9BURK|nr:protein phosphatase CheZ [Paucibacter sp. R3-3]MDY0743196.1 protein phosphatase CheZ [Paucibacter sp. R3-3]